MVSTRSSNSRVVEETWRKLSISQAARQALLSCLVLSTIFFLLFLDLNYSAISDILSISSPVLWFVEFTLCLLVLVQLLSYSLLLSRYLWSCLFGMDIHLTETQCQLMAIPVTNDSFITTPEKQKESKTHGMVGQWTGPNSNDATPKRLSGGFTKVTPRYINTSASQSPFLNSSILNSSCNSFEQSLNLSGMSQSPGRYDLDQMNMRARRSSSVPVSRPSKSQNITDLNTLHRYIQEEKEKEHIKQQASPENLNSTSMSFWNYGSNPLDIGHLLRRFTYQLSPRSAASPLQSSSCDTSGIQMEEVWSKLGVQEDDLYRWSEKLRKWLSFTIVTRLYSQIKDINATLQKIGCEDTQIGEVGVSMLKQLALTKGAYVPNLNSVVPYLDVTANQEYLINRIKDLSTGSMSAFSWNRGGSYGKPWSEHLPTDASLIVHFFCCYLDSRLPAQPRFPDGKSFTSQHFVKTPDKPAIDKKDSLQIYQSVINPPHFQINIDGEIVNLTKGRNNMFHTLLLFLYHIKTKENGMLGRVNLGMSGLNMLWIFD